MADEQPILFGEEQKNEKFILKRETVSEKDIFNLAKYILLFSCLIYVFIAALRIFYENKGVIEVWEYSKIVLNSIISLVLGLYFGHRKEK